MRIFSMAILIVVAFGLMGVSLSAGENPARENVIIEGIKASKPEGSYGTYNEIVLRYFDPDNDDALVWTAGEGGVNGFVHGPNVWGDLAKAVGFAPGSGFYLSEVRVWWGIKSDDVTNETYSLEILAGTLENGPDGTAEPIYSEEFPLSEINADSDPTTNLGATVYTFDPPIEVPGLFFVSVYYGEYGAGEYLATIFATDLRGTFVATDWEQWDDEEWFVMSESWFAEPNNGWNMWIESVVTTEVSVDGDNTLPATLELYSNYPNPFNPSTVIDFALPSDSHVVLTVYDMLGREVTKLVDGDMQAGTHSVTFDASSLTSGVYFYRLQAGDEVRTNKMMLMK